MSSNYLKKTDTNPTETSAISIKPALPTQTRKAFAKMYATGIALITVISVFNICTSEVGCIFVNDQIKPNSWQLTV